MYLNQAQIEAIGNLLSAVDSFEPMQGQIECDGEHDGPSGVEECGKLHDYDAIDDGALSELHRLAGDVERFFDLCPTLPSEIEVARLEAELAGL